MFESSDARATREHELRVPIPQGPEIPAIIPADVSAADRFIVERMPVAARLARRHARFGAEWDDLFQEACLALVETVRSLDGAETEERAEALAVLWMRRRIVLALARRATFLSALPGHALRDWLRVQRAQRDLAGTLGRAPKAHEVAAAAQIPTERAAQLADLPTGTISLDALVAREVATGQPIVAEAAPEGAGRRDARAVRAAVERLPEPERSVIACQYGIGGRRVGVRALARQLRMSPRRIIALRQEGLELLRGMLGEL